MRLGASTEYCQVSSYFVELATLEICQKEGPPLGGPYTAATETILAN